MQPNTTLNPVEGRNASAMALQSLWKARTAPARDEVLCFPKGPCTQIVYTLAPMYLYREYFTAKVYTVWVHGPLGFSA